MRIGLRLVDALTEAPLAGVPVEVWHADHEGRYSGFAPFTPSPGEVVTSKSVPLEIVAPSETFLRGTQHTDDHGICDFETIYPGWYASRTVHIHAAAQLATGRAVTQLYFPDELTDQVFARPHTQTARRATRQTPPTASSPTATAVQSCSSRVTRSTA